MILITLRTVYHKNTLKESFERRSLYITNQQVSKTTGGCATRTIGNYRRSNEAFRPNSSLKFKFQTAECRRPDGTPGHDLSVWVDKMFIYVINGVIYRCRPRSIENGRGIVRIFCRQSALPSIT